MIRVLIMDDTQEKIDKIKSVLLSKCLLKEEMITVAKSINSGRKKLAEEIYDLLILDLVMPVSDGEEIDAQGNSEKFVEEMSRVGRLHKPVYIIALTQYEDKIEKHKQEYSKKLWKLIHYDLKESDWEDILQEAVDTIIATKNQLFESLKESERYDIGIICALPIEFDQMKAAFGKNWKNINIEDSPFSLHSINIRTEVGHTIKVIACCNNVAGMQAASVTASYLLSRFALKTLFMTGFCAGFKKDDVNYGDLFIAESEYDYGSGKLSKNKENEQVLIPEPKQMQCSYEILSRINNFISENDIPTKLYTEITKANLWNDNIVPTIHMSPGACGSYVVKDEDFMEQLLDVDNRKLKGLDMEGYGVYLAGHMLKRNCVLIKGIADFGNKEKNDKYHKVCSYASAWFVMQYIKMTL